MALMDRQLEFSLSYPTDDLAARSSGSSLGNGVMVIHGPLGVTSRASDGWHPECSIPHAQHSKLGGQAIQVQANAVKVGIGGASRQRRRDT